MLGVNMCCEFCARNDEKMQALWEKELSPKEVSHLIGVSVRTLERWAREKRGPVRRRRCGRVYYPLSALLHWQKTEDGSSYPSAILRQLAKDSDMCVTCA